MKGKSLKHIINRLEDNKKYTIFLTGKGQCDGSFRIDNACGSEIKQNHLIIEFYDRAEVYQNEYKSDLELHETSTNTIIHKIEHAIKECYYKREGLKQIGMKGGIDFHIQRVNGNGEYSRMEVSGEILSKELNELIRNSKILTILEKGSNADKMLQKILHSKGKLKVHKGDKYFSDLTPEERARYRIGDDYKIDPFSSPDNVTEHHKD